MIDKIKKQEIEKFDILIVDGMNYLHKYLNVFRELKNSKGTETGIYYGFLSLMFRLKKDYNSEIIVAWDRESDVRKKINGTYKHNRTLKHEAMGNESERKLKEKIKYTEKILSLMGIKQYYCEGYEADDIAAKIVSLNKNKKILLLSEDKDLFQLLSDNVKIMRKNKAHKEEIFTKERIEEIHDIDVNSYTLFKAIVGDRGDNVFGVPYINKFQVKNFCKSIDGDLGRIYSINRSKRFRKIKNRIIMNFGLIENNYKLVKLYTKFNINEIEIKEDRNKFKNILKRYELKSILKQIGE